MNRAVIPSDRAELRYGTASVALYIVPKSEQPTAKHRIIAMSRDPSLFGDDPNVKRLTAMAAAWNSA